MFILPQLQLASPEMSLLTGYLHTQANLNLNSSDFWPKGINCKQIHITKIFSIIIRFPGTWVYSHIWFPFLYLLTKSHPSYIKDESQSVNSSAQVFYCIYAPTKFHDYFFYFHILQTECPQTAASSFSEIYLKQMLLNDLVKNKTQHVYNNKINVLLIVPTSSLLSCALGKCCSFYTLQISGVEYIL